MNRQRDGNRIAGAAAPVDSRSAEWAAGPALTLLVIAGAFWDGLYAPAQQLPWVAALALAVLWLRAKARLSRWEWTAVGLVLAGAALSLLAPAGWGSAAHGPVLAAGWVLAFLTGKRLAGRPGVEEALGRAVAIAGALILFGGLAAISYLPPHHSGRLASFLGYPIAVGILGLMGLACSLPGVMRESRWGVGLAFGNGLALLLSGSRGVWAAAALLTVYLGWQAPALLRRSWGPVAWAFAAALWVGPAVAASQRSAALSAAELGLAAAVTTAHCARSGTGWSLRRALPLLLLFLLWATALVAAPGWGWFLGRAGALPLTEGSSVERWVFLKDGWALAGSLPLGAGLRGWAALHLRHASYGYYSAEVHSAPLELAISFGWAGAAGFLLLLSRLWYGLWQGQGWPPERTALLGGMGALGVHALVDWDLSYGLLMLLLWMGCGLVPERRTRPEAEVETEAPLWPAAALASFALVGALVLGTGDFLTHQAQQSLAAGHVNQAYLHASMATAVTPWNDLSHAVEGQVLSAAGDGAAAAAELQAARRLAPWEPWYAELLGRELQAAGRLAEAAAAYRDLTWLWPWHTPAYETALQSHMTMLLTAEWQGDRPLAEELRRSGRQILAALAERKAAEPPGMPRAPMAADTPVIRQARERFTGSP